MKNTISILRNYLGAKPAWLDLRKNAILKDRIDITRWQTNMNFLIFKHTAFGDKELDAFHNWARTIRSADGGYPIREYELDDYFENIVSPILKNIVPGHLPPLLYPGADRYWFLAAYPDVFEYFYPQINWDVAARSDDDLHEEERRMAARNKELKPIFEIVDGFLAAGKGNQTKSLIIMKDFYKNELNLRFSLGN